MEVAPIDECHPHLGIDPEPAGGVEAGKSAADDRDAVRRSSDIGGGHGPSLATWFSRRSVTDAGRQPRAWSAQRPIMPRIATRSGTSPIEGIVAVKAVEWPGLRIVVPTLARVTSRTLPRLS